MNTEVQNFKPKFKWMKCPFLKKILLFNFIFVCNDIVWMIFYSWWQTLTEKTYKKKVCFGFVNLQHFGTLKISSGKIYDWITQNCTCTKFDFTLWGAATTKTLVKVFSSSEFIWNCSSINLFYFYVSYATHDTKGT